MAVNNYVQSIINNINNFGSLPEIPQQILEISMDPNASLLSIGLLVEKDAGLSSQILRKVNSSFYGLSSKVTDIKQAVSILGMNEIRNIAMTSSIAGMFSGKENKYYEKIFQKSFCAAIASDLIAGRAGLKNRDDVYMSGLFLYLGQMVFLQIFSNEYIDIIQKAEQKKAELTEIEEDHFDTTNNQIGEIICDNWNLPDNIKQCVKYCKMLDPAKEDGMQADIFKMIYITTLGSLAADIFFGWDPDGSLFKFKELYKKVNMAQSIDADEILSEIPQILKDAGAVFLFKIDPNLSYEPGKGRQTGGPVKLKLAE